MKELDENIGKIYQKNDFYYLEKIFNTLGDLVNEEEEIKVRAKRHGFKIIKAHWSLEENPYYYIQTIINDYDVENLDPLRYVFKLKLKYMK